MINIDEFFWQDIQPVLALISFVLLLGCGCYLAWKKENPQNKKTRFLLASGFTFFWIIGFTYFIFFVWGLWGMAQMLNEMSLEA